MSYTSRTPCKFFQQGNCRRGNSCKFGHFLANDNNRTTSNDDPYKSFISPTSIDKHKKQILDDMADAASYALTPLTSAYSLADPCAVNLIQARDISPKN